MSDERTIAERFGLPICEEIESFAFVRDKTSIIPYLFSKQKRILPLSMSEKGVTVAVADPLDLDSLEELRLMLKKAVFPVYSPKEVIEAAIERCYSHKDAETKRFFSDLEKESLQNTSEEQN